MSVVDPRDDDWVRHGRLVPLDPRCGGCVIALALAACVAAELFRLLTGR